MTKREWFVAICDVSGEHAGNPPCFDAAMIYGPYTAKQALKASKLGDEFPTESYVITIFKPYRSLNHDQLMALIRDQITEAKADAEAEAREPEGCRHDDRR